jgi:hypothetical protein
MNCRAYTKEGKRCHAPALGKCVCCRYEKKHIKRFGRYCATHQKMIHQGKSVNLFNHRQFVYFIESNGLVKIGRTTDLTRRFGAIWPVLKLLGTTRQFSEQTIHSALAEFRVEGEWFKPSEQMQQFITERPT